MHVELGVEGMEWDSCVVTAMRNLCCHLDVLGCVACSASAYKDRAPAPPHRTLHAAAPQEAVAQLQQLTERRPGDADVWRVLAESQAGLGDQPAAIASYRRAWQEVQEAGSSSRSALDVLQGLAGQLVACGQEQQVWRGGAWLAAARQRG